MVVHAQVKGATLLSACHERFDFVGRHVLQFWGGFRLRVPRWGMLLHFIIHFNHFNWNCTPRVVKGVHACLCQICSLLFLCPLVLGWTWILLFFGCLWRCVVHFVCGGMGWGMGGGVEGTSWSVVCILLRSLFAVMVGAACVHVRARVCARACV